MSRDKQIEESNSCCNSCIHRFVCFQCDDDTLVCSQHKDERNYRKASDGEWGFDGMSWTCSKCGEYALLDKYKQAVHSDFCPIAERK